MHIVHTLCKSLESGFWKTLISIFNKVYYPWKMLKLLSYVSTQYFQLGFVYRRLQPLLKALFFFSTEFHDLICDIIGILMDKSCKCYIHIKGN